MYSSWALKKLIKYLAKKSFGVFGGVLLTPQNTLKLYSAKCFINFLRRSKKYILYNFKVFFTAICWYRSIMFIVIVKQLKRMQIQRNQEYYQGTQGYRERFRPLPILPMQRLLNENKKEPFKTHCIVTCCCCFSLYITITQIYFLNKYI